MVSQNDRLCPCDSGREYDRCCGPYLAGIQKAPTAELLMRSRYTAYVEGNEDYLSETWHSDFRPDTIEAVGGEKWLGLKVRRIEAGGPEDSEGEVEFVARFKIDGEGHRLHEISRFVRLGSCWLYTSGELIQDSKR